MTVKEILDKYIDLEKSCLMEKEKKEVMEMLYKHKEALSLRDEIGTCPNIEVEMDVMDKFPFFIRPYHVKEEDKALIAKEMKCLCYLVILKGGFSAYSSPVLLIAGSHKRQKSSDRFQTLKCENSKNQSGISTPYRHIFSIRKL